MSDTRLGRRRSFLLAGLITGAVLVVPFLIFSLPESTRATIGTVVFIGVIACMLVTVAIGTAITSILPPLAPVSELSILGKRAVGFAKFALATAALFSAAFIGWITAEMYSTSTDNVRFANATWQILELLAIAVVCAAFVFWVWLSVDLLRIGRQRRLNTVDLLLHRVYRKRQIQRTVRRLVRFTIDSWYLVLLAFYVVPLLVVYPVLIWIAG